ncbi:MAG: N-acetylglutaminylglutamine amidotransferase [Armatimonadaceae bacterium]
MNSFVGVWGSRNPAEELHRSGTPTEWHDTRVAFGGAPVYHDSETGIVVSGVYVPVGKPVSLAEIAAPFVRQGAEVGKALPGMYALAFYNTRTGELTLLRDRAGARTLYYRPETDGSVWFAARLRTLGGSARSVESISLPALRDYLTCAYVPGERTLWRGVSELRPAEAMVFPGGARTTYWKPEEGPAETTIPMAQYAANLRPLLENAVADCLPEAGEFGAYLSGGVDSSLIVALAAKQRGGRNIRTYSIHFGHDLPNELEFSSLVAAHCGTQHRILELPAKTILAHLEETIADLDDPIGDPLTVPNLLLGKAAAESVGVILNGEGGDPIFGGPKNIPMLLHELYESATLSERELLKPRIEAYFRSYQKCYDDLPRLLTPEVQKALATEPPMEEMLLPYLRDDAPMRQYLNRLMQINAVFKGADHILTKVNNLTSACGLTGYSPLFDPRIVEAGFAVPSVYKLSGTQEKAVLKQAVADLLPETILTRPKSGMLVPVQRWFRQEMHRYAKDLLLSRHARIRPYLNQKVLEEWLRYRSPLPHARQGIKLWLVLTLEIWLRVNEK